MRFFWHAATQTLSGSVDWDERTEGPPKGAHGASIMMVFDEILAYPVWRSGVPAFTANVNINLRKMVPFNTAARFESRVARREGRKCFLEGAIYSADKTVKYADATGLWIVSNGIGGSSAVWADALATDARRDASTVGPAADGSGALTVTDPVARALSRPYAPAASIDAASGNLVQLLPGAAATAAGSSDGVGASYRHWVSPAPPTDAVLPFDTPSPAPESYYTAAAAGVRALFPGRRAPATAPTAPLASVFAASVTALPLPALPSAQAAGTAGLRLGVHTATATPGVAGHARTAPVSFIHARL
jgi:acyl-coenzyme A thioesterase PaaI-like protein